MESNLCVYETNSSFPHKVKLSLYFNIISSADQPQGIVNWPWSFGSWHHRYLLDNGIYTCSYYNLAWKLIILLVFVEKQNTFLGKSMTSSYYHYKIRKKKLSRPLLYIPCWVKRFKLWTMFLQRWHVTTVLIVTVAADEHFNRITCLRYAGKWQRRKLISTCIQVSLESYECFYRWRDVDIIYERYRNQKLNLYVENHSFLKNKIRFMSKSLDVLGIAFSSITTQRYNS